jgi:hypothetical protein
LTVRSAKLTMMHMETETGCGETSCGCLSPSGRA